jgi:hypothetical protein
MITEHIELPDPELYREVQTTKHWGFGEEPIWSVVTYKIDDRGGNDPLYLDSDHDAGKMRAVAIEMQKRLDVARTLLGLKPR